MILSTTNRIYGREIRSHLQMVNSEVVLGINVFRDIFAAIRNIVGGRAHAYEKAVRSGREMALAELEAQAAAVGADAIVGVQLGHESLPRGVLIIRASGTAVSLG